MRVLIVSLGTAGDVVPLAGLAVRIKEAGHDVSVAAEGYLASLVRNLGVAFHPLTTHGEADGQEELPSHADVMGLREILSMVQEQGARLEAVVQHGVDADLVLLSATATPLGWHMAEAMDVESMGVFLQPLHPTRELAPMFTSSDSWGSWGNRATGWAMLHTFDIVWSRAAKAMRLRFDLPRASSRRLRRELEERRWPVCYGFSPAVVPRPSDWRDGLEVVGYWWPAVKPDWQPPDELVAFLEAGPPPVLIGFGSSKPKEQGDRLSEVTAAALRRAGLRGVIQSGWAGLSVIDDDVITVGEVPHEWLMPRTTAVVHHAGAGVTAAALRAGIPSIPVPNRSDQPFWTRRLVSLGVSPGRLRLKDLAPGELAEAMTQAVSNPSYRARARALATRIRAEDGAGRVIDTINRFT